MTVAAAELTERESALLASVPTGLLINGEWRNAASGATFSVEDPSTGGVLANIADAGAEDGAAALDAAVAAQDSWAATAPRARAEILRKAFDLVTARAEDFALLMTLEMGKPLAEARGEVTYGAEFLRWFSEEAVRSFGRYSSNPEGTAQILVQKKPVGPCLLITPWNFPLAMATRKIAPAIAAGCTMVFKPANLTPLTSQLFAQTLMEAGLPAGVLNVVSTSDAGGVTGPLVKDTRLRKLSFTGSTPVGKRLLADASTTVLRTSMELGGNAPFLVFEDADLEAAVDGAMAAKLRNMGEACTAANRFLVHESVAEEFATQFAAKMAAMTTGRGTDPETKVGPLIDANEEIFGPVAPIVTFKNEDEAVALANATEYGLVAYVFTQDHNRGLRMANRIETGMMGLNAGVISNAAAPFGGVKQSGLGREGSIEGIAEYQYTQYIGFPNPNNA